MFDFDYDVVKEAVAINRQALVIYFLGPKQMRKYGSGVAWTDLYDIYINGTVIESKDWLFAVINHELGHPLYFPGTKIIGESHKEIVRSEFFLPESAKRKIHSMNNIIEDMFINVYYDYRCVGSKYNFLKGLMEVYYSGSMGDLLEFYENLPKMRKEYNEKGHVERIPNSKHKFAKAYILIRKAIILRLQRDFTEYYKLYREIVRILKNAVGGATSIETLIEQERRISQAFDSIIVCIGKGDMTKQEGADMISVYEHWVKKEFPIFRPPNTEFWIDRIEKRWVGKDWKR